MILRTIFASFLKFYGKEYEEIKHIPISRLWGYFDYMGEYNKDPKDALEEAKAEAIKKADWGDEVKELKAKLKHGKQKTLNSNPKQK